MNFTLHPRLYVFVCLVLWYFDGQFDYFSLRCFVFAFCFHIHIHSSIFICANFAECLIYCMLPCCPFMLDIVLTRHVVDPYDDVDVYVDDRGV